LRQKTEPALNGLVLVAELTEGEADAAPHALDVLGLVLVDGVVDDLP